MISQSCCLNFVKLWFNKSKPIFYYKPNNSFIVDINRDVETEGYFPVIY